MLQISEVVEVRPGSISDLKKGDIILEWFDSWKWQDYTSVSVQASKNLRVLPASVAALVPLTYFLGGVGQTGLSAYFGILGEASPSVSDIVVISGAAGAVGTVVGQLAKQRGSFVVGICGSDEKAHSLVAELGFDGAVNYKSGALESNLDKALQGRKATIYFDNVGGNLSDLIITSFMGPKSQVVICGQIDMYNTDKEYPPALGREAEESRRALDITRERYLVFNYEQKFAAGLRHLLVLAAGGELKLIETYRHGLENAPQAFCDMMAGKNNGKMLVACVPNEDLPFNLRFYNALRSYIPAFLKKHIAANYVKV